MSSLDIRPVRFLHIPKCGGSTFNYILNREYRNGKNFSFSGNSKADRQRFEDFRAEHSGLFGLFCGHAPMNTGFSEVDDALTITMFRDPVCRVRSFCQHVSEGKSPHLVDRFPPQSFNLDDFLDSGLGELSNLQTKMMINTGSCEEATFMNQSGDRRALGLAMKNLDERIAVFGLLERYDESLIQFADYLGWALPVYAKRNVQDEKRLLVFEARHLQRIEALNAVDQVFYKHVCELYEERYVLTPTQRKQLKKQQFLNKKVLPILDAVHPRKLKRTLRSLGGATGC